MYYWNGIDWNTIGINMDNGVGKSFDLKVNQAGKLFMVYLNTNNKGTCKEWDGNTWNLVGLPDFTATLYDVSMVINQDGNPTVTYNDLDASMGKLSSKRFINPVTNIEDNKQNTRKLSIYPNPAGNQLYLENSVSFAARYFISDLAGRKLREGKIDHQSLDISDLIPGFYLLNVEGFATMKFIKE